MKKTIFLVVLFIYNLSFCQEKSFFLLIDDDVYMERGKTPLEGVYEFKLSFK